MQPDKNKLPKVLHIDVESGWRGGQNQAINLFQSELKNGMDSHFVCKINSEIQNVLIENKLPFTAINYKNELDFFCAFKIAKLARSNQFNIIVCHSSHSLSLGLLSKLFFSKPKIIGIRRVDFKISDNVFSKWKYISNNLAQLVCVSSAIKKIMKNTVTDESKLTVIHDGIDTAKFQNIETTQLKSEYNIQNKILVGTIAAFVGHKDYPTLLRTIKEVKEIRNDIVFFALGEGELLADMNRMAKDLGIQENIFFTGFRKDVGAFLNLFDIFILTSNEEGLGSSVLDAMSVGLPVVATKAGGIPEIVEDKVNGLLCEIGDSKNLANAVCQLTDNKELRKLYAENSLKMVKEFSIGKTYQKYLDLYTSLLSV